MARRHGAGFHRGSTSGAGYSAGKAPSGFALTTGFTTSATYKAAFFPFFYMVIMVIIRACINICKGIHNDIPGNENEELFDAAAEAGSEIEEKLAEGKGGNVE